MVNVGPCKILTGVTRAARYRGSEVLKHAEKWPERHYVSVQKAASEHTHTTPHLFTSNQVKYLYITNTECVYKYFSAVNTHLTWILKPCSWTKKDLLAERFRIPHLRNGTVKKPSTKRWKYPPILAHFSLSLHTCSIPFIFQGDFEPISWPSLSFILRIVVILEGED